MQDYEEEFCQEADILGRLGHEEDEEALVASYISRLRHEIGIHFALGHAKNGEEDLGLTVMEPIEPLEEPLEDFAEKPIPVGDNSRDEVAYEAFWNYDDLVDWGSIDDLRGKDYQRLVNKKYQSVFDKLDHSLYQDLQDACVKSEDESDSDSDLVESDRVWSDSD